MITFQAQNLNPDSDYILGLSWWDFNSVNRTQEIEISGSKSDTSKIILPPTKLPGYQRLGQLPQTIQLPLPPDSYKNGKVRITTKKTAGANAVISEIWIWQKDAKSPLAKANY